MESDLKSADWLVEKVRSSDGYAQNLYAALCNNSFQKRELWPILKDDQWSCSWRYAGGIVADIRCQGNYMDWYCSGSVYEEKLDGQRVYVQEGTVTEEIRSDIEQLGWMIIEEPDHD